MGKRPHVWTPRDVEGLTLESDIVRLEHELGFDHECRYGVCPHARPIPPQGPSGISLPDAGIEARQ